MENIKLICFDLDKTLIKQNSWYELNMALGVTHEEDQQMLDEYTQGKLTYEDWTKKLLMLFRRSDKSNLKSITEILSRSYTFRPEAMNIVEYAKSKGYHVAVISGSIDILIDLVAKDLGVELAEATNKFVFDEDDRLVDILSSEDSIAKLNHLESFCRKLGINISECICIGDGDNDVEMFRKTGRGVTFKGSKIEKEAWKVIDSLDDLRQII